MFTKLVSQRMQKCIKKYHIQVKKKSWGCGHPKDNVNVDFTGTVSLTELKLVLGLIYKCISKDDWVNSKHGCRLAFNRHLTEARTELPSKNSVHQWTL